MRLALASLVPSFAILTAVSMLGCGGGGTSLEGAVDCAATSCSGGQVCVTVSGGVDAGTGGPSGSHECVDVPSGCDIVDCAGNTCPTCIQNLCYPTGVSTVMGRDVSCYGQ